MLDGIDPLAAAESYSAALRRLSERLARDWVATDWSDGPLSWRFFAPREEPTPAQGWKIHVSASAAESASLLPVVGAVARAQRAAFKVPRSIDDVVFLNSGDAGVQQLGKIACVYPRDDAHARELLDRLDAAWPASNGPEVQTDLHVRPGSAVSFRYGAYGGGGTVASSAGLHAFAIVLPDGSTTADTRRDDGAQLPGAPPPPIAGCPPRPCPIAVGDTLQVATRRITVLAQLSDSPRARTFLGADLDSLETVVLKTARPGVAGDATGLDVRDRLAREFDVLTALAARAGVAPCALAWQDGEWPLLVMEDFRGESLAELPRRQRIERLPQLADAVARVHAAGFVHGDVKLANAVCRGDGVGLIDFELAEPVGTIARSGGTRGHLAPETVDRVPMTPARDVYALGACVAHAVLDTPPALLGTGSHGLGALLRNEGAHSAARLVETLTARDPDIRPTASAAAAALSSCVDSLAEFVPSTGHPGTEPERGWYRHACNDSARLAVTYATTTREGTHWRNTHFMRAFDCEAINLGAAGIVLGLLTVDTASHRAGFADAVMGGARWLAARPAEGNAAGLFTGNAGVAIALAVTGRRFGDESLLAAARERFTVACADRRELDLFSGAAGVAWTACLLSDVLDERWPLEVAGGAVDGIRARSFESDGIPIWTTDPASDPAYLGCAHGSSGIAMALACWGRRRRDQECVDTAREAFRRIARAGRTSDGLALRMRANGTGRHAVGNWCHGVAGWLWCVLQGLGDDDTLRAEIDWAVDSLRDATSTGTPTYCHGLAGQLELWRMLRGVPRHGALADARAGKVARALRIVHHERDGHCAWISDDPDVVTPDLWIGFLGPATALALHAIGSNAPLLSAEWLAAVSARAS
ncbi:MAG TPA: lanthionine synthetase LanC family protein [Steroidobacteraceae bacterium]|nr:lanthionine synthetase LanC family protein [Steroidobacteraceae bacterium]